MCFLSICSGSTWWVTATVVTASPSELARVRWPSTMFVLENARYIEDRTAYLSNSVCLSIHPLFFVSPPTMLSSIHPFTCQSYLSSSPLKLPSIHPSVPRSVLTSFNDLLQPFHLFLHPFLLSIFHSFISLHPLHYPSIQPSIHLFIRPLSLGGIKVLRYYSIPWYCQKYRLSSFYYTDTEVLY